MVASRKPQFQVNNILDMASLKPRDEDIPESDERLAGYILLMLLASPSSHVIVHWAGLDAVTGQQDLFSTALRFHPACPTPLSTPTSASASAATSISTLQDSQKSRSDSKTTGDMENSSTMQERNEATKNKNQRSMEPSKNETSQPDDDDSKNPGDSEFDYHLSQETRTPTEDCTGQNGQTGATFIGGQYFPLPSPRGWKLVLELTKQLKPLSDYLTMGQRIHLARRITKSRCLTVAKELQIQREIFSATTSVNDLITKSQINSSRVLAVLTQWRRSFFEQISSRLDKQLEKRLSRKNTAPATKHEQQTLADRPTTAAHTPAPISEVIDLAADSPKKRKANPRPTPSKRVKITTDEEAAAPPSSPTQQQSPTSNKRPPAAGKQQAQRQRSAQQKKNKKSEQVPLPQSRPQNADSTEQARRNNNHNNSRQRQTQRSTQRKPQRRGRKGASKGMHQQDD
jgi:hypothetical protein